MTDDDRAAPPAAKRRRSVDGGAASDEDRLAPSSDADGRVRALRAVWLALPDEDPPERGLGELMAAAGAKAAALARPTRWQRVHESLRRPLMLALASIVVVVAGGMLIGRSAKDVAPASDHASSSPRPLAPMSAAPEAPTPASAMAPPPPSTVTRVRAPEDRHKTDVGGPPGAGKLETARPVAKIDATPQNAPAPRPALVEPVRRLALRCRAAATRGDCPAARSLAQQIASQNASYYQDHVATDGSITKCLASE